MLSLPHQSDSSNSFRLEASVFRVYQIQNHYASARQRCSYGIWVWQFIRCSATTNQTSSLRSSTFSSWKKLHIYLSVCLQREVSTKRAAPRQTTTKIKFECPCHFRQFGLIHRPNYLTLRNKWGLTTTLTKSAVSFFRCHLSESPRDLLAIRVDKYLLGCFALYIVLSNVVYASTLWA